MEQEKKKYVVAVSFKTHVEATNDAEALREAMFTYAASEVVRSLQMHVVAAIPLTTSPGEIVPERVGNRPEIETRAAAAAATAEEPLRDIAKVNDIPF